VPDHLLVNYRKSLVAICLAQFNSTKGFEGGGKVQAITFFCRGVLVNHWHLAFFAHWPFSFEHSFLSTRCCIDVRCWGAG